LNLLQGAAKPAYLFGQSGGTEGYLSGAFDAAYRFGQSGGADGYLSGAAKDAHLFGQSGGADGKLTAPFDAAYRFGQSGGADGYLSGAAKPAYLFGQSGGADGHLSGAPATNVAAKAANASAAADALEAGRPAPPVTGFVGAPAISVAAKAAYAAAAAAASVAGLPAPRQTGFVGGAATNVAAKAANASAAATASVAGLPAPRQTGFVGAPATRSAVCAEWHRNLTFAHFCESMKNVVAVRDAGDKGLAYRAWAAEHGAGRFPSAPLTFFGSEWQGWGAQFLQLHLSHRALTLCIADYVFRRDESTPPSKHLRVWRAEALRAIKLEHPDAAPNWRAIAGMMLPIVASLAAQHGFGGRGMPSLHNTASYVRRNWHNV